MAEQKNKKKQNRYQIIRLLNNQINIAKQYNPIVYPRQP